MSTRIRVKAVELLLLMVPFAVLSAVFLFLIGADALQEKNDFQFFADSNTYLQTYAGESESFDGTVIGVNSNYLGPLTVLQLAGGNIYLVMLLNVYIFCHSILRITALLNLNPLKVGLLLLLSPLTLSSLVSVNKEIFVFPFIAFALSGYMRRSLLAVALALLFSLLARWQLTAFYCVMLAITMSPVRIFRRRGTMVVMILLGVSAVYLLLARWLAPVIAAMEASIENYDGGGSGVFEVLLNYQQQGLYFLIFPFKALHLLFGAALRPERLFNPTNIYNDLFVTGHCLVALLVFITLFVRRRFTLKSDLIFATVIFLVVFCLSPVYAPRYLYAVFVIWMLVLAGAPRSLREQYRLMGPKQRSIPSYA